MRTTPFEFHAPETVSDALQLLDKYEDEAKVLAGGMSMMPAMNLGLLRPAAVVSLNHISSLDEIREDDGFVRIGALARHAAVASDPLVQRNFGLLHRAASVIGDVQIRNRGTIGGSVVHADPAGDYLSPLVALDAQFVVENSGDTRTIGAQDFFVDIMRTSVEPTEILIEVGIPKLPEDARTAYKRLVRVEGNFAIVTAAAVATPETVRVTVGGVASRPVTVEQPADGLGAGDSPAYEALGAAVYDACEDAYGDLTGSSEYRRAMARVYAERAVRAAYDQN